MSVKTTGAEYKAYIAETDPKWWPDGSYMDDTVIIVNGKEVGDDYDFDPSNLKDIDQVVIECGTYYKFSADLDPSSLTAHFRSWRKAQSTVRFSVEVNKDKFDELKALIKANGGKVA